MRKKVIMSVIAIVAVVGLTVSFVMLSSHDREDIESVNASVATQEDVNDVEREEVEEVVENIVESEETVGEKDITAENEDSIEPENNVTEGEPDGMAQSGEAGEGESAPTTPANDSTESMVQGNGTGEEVLAGGMTTMIDGKEVPCIIMDEDEDYIYAYVDPMYDPDGLGRSITIPKTPEAGGSEGEAEAPPAPEPTPTPEGNANTGNSNNNSNESTDVSDIDWFSGLPDSMIGYKDVPGETVDPNAPAYTGPRTPVY